MAGGDQIIQDVHDLAQQIENKIQDLFNGINDVLSWVPDFLSDLIQPIKDAVNTFDQSLQDFWNHINTVLSEPGSPDALNRAAQAWTNQVENIVTSVAGTLSPDQLQSGNDWTGIAANAYKATIPVQTSALGAIKTAANQMATSLTTMANALNSFYTALKVALASFLVAIVAAIAACCTVVGTPAGITALITFAGACVTAIGAEIKALVDISNSANTTNTTIVQTLNDNTTFPNGSWPVSTADMSDDHGGWQVA